MRLFCNLSIFDRRVTPRNGFGMTPQNIDDTSSGQGMYLPPPRVLLSVSVLLWIAISLFNTGIFVFSVEEEIQQYGFFGALRWTLFYHSPWLVMMPCILFFARKFPLNEQVIPKNLFIHLVFALLVTFIASLLHTVFIYIRMGEPFQFGSVPVNYLYYFDDRFLLYLVILVGYYAMDYYQKQYRESLRESQLQELINREKLNSFKEDIQPSFLLNTLKDIQKLVTDKPFLAEQLIADLAQMIRKLLNNSQKKDISTGEDLQFLKSYAAILEARLGRKIHFLESVREEDKKKHATISLLVISIVEELLNRDGHLPPSFNHILYETVDTEESEGIRVHLKQFTSDLSGVESWFDTGKLSGRDRIFGNITESSGKTGLRFMENGTLTVSVTFPGNL